MNSGKAYGSRADHMDGRTDIGVGIKPVEFCHELCEKIVTGKLHGAQLLTGGVNQIGKTRLRYK